jgi:hypothetical protein
LFQVPESFSEPRLLGFLLDLTFDRVQFFVGLRRLVSRCTKLGDWRAVTLRGSLLF